MCSTLEKPDQPQQRQPVDEVDVSVALWKSRTNRNVCDKACEIIEV